MKNINLMAHVANLVSIIHYHAPDHGQVRPCMLSEGEEVVEILTGGEVFFPDASGRRVRYGRGTIFWHQAGEATIFDTTPQAPYRCWSIDFAVSAPARPVPRVGQWRQPGKLDEFGTEILELFTGNADRGLLGMYCYGTLLRQFCGLPDFAELPLPPALRRAVRMIDSKHGRNCSVAEILREAQTGQAQIFRLFREYLHCTPREYVQKQTMSYARFLLLSGTLSIKQVADACGYANLEVFYRNFRRCHGMTPGEFLMQHRPGIRTGD